MIPIFWPGTGVETPTPTPSLSTLSVTIEPFPSRIPAVQPGMPMSTAALNQSHIQWFTKLGTQFDNWRPTPITVDTAPTLTVQDAAAVYLVTTHNHLVQWTGYEWVFYGGDTGSGYYQSFAVAPTGEGWAVCDGSTTTILTVGATLGAQSVVTPITADLYLRR